MTTRLALSDAAHLPNDSGRSGRRKARRSIRGGRPRAGTIGRARGVAQPGSALRSGRRGPQFKSGHPDRSGENPGSENLVFPRWVTRLSAVAAAASILGGVLRAVVFDVDFTLARPGPDLGPDGYRELGLRYGLALDPARYEEARAAAFAEVKRHPELDHDEEIWVLFTERIIQGMGGVGATPTGRRSRWSGAGRIRRISSCTTTRVPALDGGARARAQDRAALELVARPRRVRRHHGLDADAVLTSYAHGKTKPHESIFRAMLDLLEVDAPRHGDDRRHARGGHRGRAARSG